MLSVLLLLLLTYPLQAQEEGFLINPVQVGQIDEDHYYVLDNLQQIHIYSKNDGLQTSLLTQGRGPGETQQAISVCVLDAQSIAVLDVTQFKVVLFSLNESKSWKFNAEHVLQFRPEGVPFQLICTDEGLVVMSQSMMRDRSNDVLHFDQLHLNSGTQERLGSFSFATTASQSIATHPRFYHPVQVGEHIYIFNNLSEEVIKTDKTFGNVRLISHRFPPQSEESKALMQRMGERQLQMNRTAGRVTNRGGRQVQADNPMYPRYMNLVTLREALCFTHLKDAETAGLYCSHYGDSEGGWSSSAQVGLYPRSRRLLGAFNNQLVWSKSDEKGVELIFRE